MDAPLLQAQRHSGRFLIAAQSMEALQAIWCLNSGWLEVVSTPLKPATHSPCTS